MSRTQSCASDRGKKKWTASLSDHSVSLSFPSDPPDALCSALLASKIVILVCDYGHNFLSRCKKNKIHIFKYCAYL